MKLLTQQLQMRLETWCLRLGIERRSVLEAVARFEDLVDAPVDEKNKVQEFLLYQLKAFSDIAWSCYEADEADNLKPVTSKRWDGFADAWVKSLLKTWALEMAEFKQQDMRPSPDMQEWLSGLLARIATEKNKLKEQRRKVYEKIKAAMKGEPEELVKAVTESMPEEFLSQLADDEAGLSIMCGSLSGLMTKIHEKLANSKKLKIQPDDAPIKLDPEKKAKRVPHPKMKGVKFDA